MSAVTSTRGGAGLTWGASAIEWRAGLPEDGVKVTLRYGWVESETDPEAPLEGEGHVYCNRPVPGPGHVREQGG